MRIVRLAEFLAMPSGTVYRKATQPWAFGEMSVKYATIGRDWVEQSFGHPQFTNGEQLDDRYDAMAEQAASFPLETEMAGREGRFDENPYFLIYEKDDLLRLRAEINKCIEAAPESPVRPANYYRAEA